MSEGPDLIYNGHAFDWKLTGNKRSSARQLRLYAEMMRSKGYEVQVETEWGAELYELEKQFYCMVSQRPNIPTIRGKNIVLGATFWTRVKGWFHK